MKTTITITDDNGTTAHVAAPASEPAAPSSEVTVSNAGPAPGTATSMPAAGNGSNGADGGPAPEWLRELIEASGQSPTGTTAEPASAAGVPALDAGAAPGD